jgi:hypothetical protein
MLVLFAHVFQSYMVKQCYLISQLNTCKVGVLVIVVHRSLVVFN